MVQSLVQHGANLEDTIEPEYAWTALDLAARQNALAPMKCLIAHGARIEHRGHYGGPLFRAIFATAEHDASPGSERTESAVDLLLQAGADVNRTSDNGETPLMCAVTAGSPRILRTLLKRGARIEARDNQGDSALLCAAAVGEAEIARILLEAGAEVDARDEDGNTPLHVAVDRGGLYQRAAEEDDKRRFDAVIRLLLDHGADARRENKKGQTPRQIAEARHCTSVLSLLRKAEARFPPAAPRPV